MGVDGFITNDPILVNDIIDHVSSLDPQEHMLLKFRKFWKFFEKKTEKSRKERPIVSLHARLTHFIIMHQMYSQYIN
jgi:hypothetical protein